jgi:hypothetical protein
MKSFLSVATLVLLSASPACFGFVPHHVSSTTTTAFRKTTTLLPPLQVVTDLNIPNSKKSGDSQLEYTIPLEDICLEDIPKVGGYVKKECMMRRLLSISPPLSTFFVTGKLLRLEK